MHNFLFGWFVWWLSGICLPVSSVPRSGRSLGEGNGNSLQCSCLENLMDRGAWWATVHGAKKSQTQVND